MKYIKYALLITITLLSFSCIDNPSGLFYSLQYESGIDDGNLDNGLTVGGLAMRNGYYFAACGNLKYKNIANDNSWTDDNPAGFLDADTGLLSGYACYRLINLDELYAIYYNSDTLDYYLLKGDTSAMSAAEGIVWSSAITITALGGESLIDIKQSNGRIFLYTETTVSGAVGNDKRFSVYSTDAAALAADTALTTELSGLTSYGELDVDHDGTNYWLITGNKLYTGLTGSLSDVTSTATAADTNDEILDNGFGGIYCHSNGDVYLSTEEGVLLKYSAGAWTDLTSAAVFNRIYDFKRVTLGTDIDVLLLGSELGYYELDLNAATPTFVSPEDADTQLTSTVQFSSIEMSNDIIKDFFVDSANNRVFGLGYTAGLWVNEYDAVITDWSWGLE